jgi:hypothetical protein
MMEPRRSPADTKSEEAVRIACEYDFHSGGPVRLICLRAPEDWQGNAETGRRAVCGPPLHPPSGCKSHNFEMRGTLLLQLHSWTAAGNKRSGR